MLNFEHKSHKRRKDPDAFDAKEDNRQLYRLACHNRIGTGNPKLEAVFILVILAIQA